jgi:hypothetical protein
MEYPLLQFQLRQMLWVVVVVWAIISTVAALRLGDQTLYYFFPFLSYRADPWSRERIGSGFDSLLSLAGYVQMFIAGMFGILAALLRDRRLQFLALAGCLVTWPYYIFDRTRNPILVIVLPAILAWVFLRLRGGVLQKAAILFGCFLLVNAWFGFIIANRSSSSITDALQEKGFNWQESQSAHHEGLNMYEELCWTNALLASGLYKPGWGQRYFAELVNPIPRALWANKPMIGIDYAIARGFEPTGDATAVTTTLSTGMIGQGVIDFGRILGPAFAAWLMSIWVAVLARLDLRGQQAGYLPLYGLGLVLTFKLGRDISLISLYTFVFGYMVVWLADRWRKSRLQGQLTETQSHGLHGS